MLAEYLEIGGNEVVNSARAFGYASTAGCRANWFRKAPCGTLADALQQEPTYEYADIALAPWFDPDDSDTSSRFLGLAGMRLENVSDSTRTASVAEKSDAGGVVSGYRHGSREVRVQGWMTARGMDALEYGMTWLRNVLEPDACGLHGGECGQADAEFFVSCPPVRRETVAYSEWVTTAVNRALNPIADATWSAIYGTGGAGTSAIVPGLGGAPARRVAFTAAPSAGSTPRISITSTNALLIPVEPGEEVVFSLDLASSGVPVGLTFTYYASGGGQVGVQYAGPFVVDSEVDSPTRVTGVTPAAPATAAKMAIDVTVNPAEVTPGAWFSASRLMVGGTGAVGYFDGNSVGNTLLDYSWAGSANAAASIMATRTQSMVPEPDDTYYPLVDTYRRFLHSVRCISGPFVVEEAISSDERHYGRLVEFTLLAEVPFVYGLPRELELSPITPTVVQDIAYNLAPYPSAELSAGAAVVATNYSTNPSAETNVTGWANGSNAALAAGGTVAAVARSTELKAVGAASAMVEFTASAAGTAGLLRVEQSVALGGAANSRYSINMWSSAVNNVGSAVLGQITLFALWQDAGSATLRVDNLGALGASGGAITASSILPPAGATKVIVRAELAVTSWSTGNKIRLFGDALAVTNP